MTMTLVAEADVESDPETPVSVPNEDHDKTLVIDIIDRLRGNGVDRFRWEPFVQAVETYKQDGNIGKLIDAVGLLQLHHQRLMGQYLIVGHVPTFQLIRATRLYLEALHKEA